MNEVHFDSLHRVLCLGAHSDDIEIGCGGTLLKLIAQHPNLHIDWIILAGDGERGYEAHRSADAFLRGAGSQHVAIERFRDSFLPYDGDKIKEYFQELRASLSPDLIFTHRREDMHQDHRCVAELTWNAFRNHVILEYEIPKYEGDLGQPNLFVPLSEELCRRKVDHLLEYFGTQRVKSWFTSDLFWALLRLRGSECRAESRFAEAFHVRKLVIA